MSGPLRLDPRGLCEPAAPALIGVSGGRDSMALLHALEQRGHRNLIVCHLDHAWRLESAAEAELVRQTAARYCLPAVLERMSPAPPGSRASSPETAGRQARLAFFARVSAAHSGAPVFLAHHADDQVETLLHHLFRGAGAGGLAGMAPHSQHIVNGHPLRLLRPLLGTWRSEIDAYVQAHALPFCEDASNTDLRHTRNRLRHQVLPALEAAWGPGLRRSLWRSAEILAAEHAYLSAAPALQSLNAELSTATVRALPLALQRRLLHAWLRGHHPGEVGFAEVERVRGLLEQRFPAKVNLPGGAHVRRRAGRLFIEPAPEPRA